MLSLELDSVDVEQGFPYDLCNTSHEIIFPCNHRIYHTQFLLFICGNNNVLCDSRQKNCCCVKESCGIVIALGTFFSFIKWCTLYTRQSIYFRMHISIQFMGFYCCSHLVIFLWLYCIDFCYVSSFLRYCDLERQN